MSDATGISRRGVVTSGRDRWMVPWVQLRTYSFSPSIFPAMIAGSSARVPAGAWVSVYDRDGRHFGNGWYNARAKIPLRVIHHGSEPVGEDYVETLLDRAVAWRMEQLRLDQQTDAYRVVNSDGDGISGLVVDRYADVLSVEVHSLAVWQRLERWLPRLHARLGTTRAVVQVDERSARNEGMPARSLEGGVVRVRENGMRFEVRFDAAHKTGFFCDQRENRRRFGMLVQGRRTLDLCCYTGGFAIAAAVLGGARDVTGVDLDEEAIAQARRNGNLNQRTRIRWVHADAFAYARQMQQNGERWGAVVLDPPKFLENREGMRPGIRKYEDLNSLAIQLVEPGGLLVTCSCSGLWTMEEFETHVIRAAHRLGRRLQVFDRTGAGPDHPVLSNCLESRYLKVLWARVW
ncbi:MAG: class I SAM-dependent rRNA methyltransferase [Verrucomicrobiae bacterium]|nr:class I SAM-dependent rRNA methyltransferase [Verrucomicrobiae bacterium]